MWVHLMRYKIRHIADFLAVSAKFVTDMELLRAAWSLVGTWATVVNQAAAHRTYRPSPGGRWLSRCAPRTRPARYCAGLQDRHAARSDRIIRHQVRNRGGVMFDRPKHDFTGAANAANRAPSSSSRTSSRFSP